MLEDLIAIVIFFFGAIIGSFLNVVILRYRSGRTLGGRSACMVCSKTLHWYELVPIGSFFTQGGKCTNCKTKISWQYPVVEAVTGFVFVLLYYRFGYLMAGTPLLFGILFAYYAFIFCLFIVLSAYDIKHKILPNQFIILFASVALIGTFLLKGDAIVLHLPNYTQILAGIILPAPFSLIWLLSKGKWMGLGDAKFMIGIGFLLGLSAGVSAIMISFWIGAIASIIMVVLGSHLGKKGVTLKSAIPFGPFLALGTFIVFLMGIDISTITSIFGGGY
jgi:leader peptidase (prepilin peptidase)/N-methyltransferase